MQDHEFEDKIHIIISEAIDDGATYDDVIAWLSMIVDQVREESNE